MKVLARIPGTAAEQQATMATVRELLPDSTPMQVYAMGAATYHAWAAGMQPSRNLLETAAKAAAAGGIDRALQAIQGWIGGKRRPQK